MINSIDKIKNFGCFIDFTKSSDLKEFKLINVLYGANGTGKSTLSNLLYCLSKNCPNKSQLLEEYCEETTEIEIKTSFGKIKKNKIKDCEEDIYVFNTNFINEHVFNGTDANIAPFKATIKLTNQEIEKIDRKLLNLSKGEKLLSKIKLKLEEKHNGIWTKYKNEFSQRIIGPRLTKVEPKITDSINKDFDLVKKELEDLYQSYKKKSEETTSLNKINEIEIQLKGIPFMGSFYKDLIDLIETDIKEVSGKRIKENIELVSNDLKKRNLSDEISPSDWFRRAGRYLFFFMKSERENCPLCNSNIKDSISNLIDEFSDYYNNDFTKLLDSLNKKEQILNQFKYDEIEKTIQLVTGDLKNLAINYRYNGVIVEKQKVELDLDKLIRLIRLKKNASTKTPEFENSVASNLTLYIEQVGMRVKEIKEIIEYEKKKINSVKLDDILKKLKEEVRTITILEFNLRSNNIIENSKNPNYHLARLEQRLREDTVPKKSILATKRLNEIAKLDAESKYVNTYLAYLGINHFKIKKDDTVTDNLTINYIETAKQKKGLRNSLSEGEKTALAFSYYISKIRAEVLEGNDKGFKDKIFVIDDPISSLDENRLFQTANLIDTFFFYSQDSIEKYPEQMFFFSHNYNFAKFLNNNLRTNSNLKEKIHDYYLQSNEPKLTNLPQALQNYSNTYLIKLKSIINFKTNNCPDYHQAKNFIPNYIRIVLETFLSFKLAIVKVDNNTNSLPTLGGLLNKMVGELNQSEDYQIKIDGNTFNRAMAIKKLNQLKRISDHESHGSISKLQEMSYISEDELKEFSKYTIQLIEYLDDIHYKKIKSMK